MPAPVQVQRQAQRAEELMKELGQGPTPPTHDKVDDNQPPPPPPPPAPPAKTYTSEEYDKLDQKYKTLQGMFNTETKRLSTELAMSQAEVNGLSARITELEAKAQTPTPRKKYTTEEDERTYGETLDMVRRAAKEEAEAASAEVINQLQARLSKLEGKTQVVDEIKQENEAQRKSTFWAKLEEAIPDWSAINEDGKFKEWLLEVDPSTGRNKQFFLREAQLAWDYSRVINIFKEWKAKTVQPAPTGQERTSELEEQIAPGGGRGGGTPASEPEKKTFKRSEIRTFYSDVTAGKYRHRPDEKAKMERAIFEATRDKRVIND